MTTTLTNAEKATFFREAAGALHEYGWCRYEFKDNEGRMCIAGALGYAMTGEAYAVWTDFDARHLGIELATIMQNRLGIDPGVDCGGNLWPAAWNNDVAVNVDEVIHVLKMAAEEIELDG